MSAGDDGHADAGRHLRRWALQRAADAQLDKALWRGLSPTHTLKKLHAAWRPQEQSR